MPNQKARRLCLAALEAALDAVEPYSCVRSRLKIVGKRLSVDHISLDLSRFRNIFLLAVGKASQQMASATLHTLDDFSIRGIVVAPEDQKLPTIDDRVEAFPAGHPLPDREGLDASQRVIQQIKRMESDELLLCLISGGASALLPSPANGIGLRDKVAITQQLLRSGGSIHEINTVRRHLSNLKGGQLAAMCPRSTVLSLIISDVPGNPLHDIGSGLTAEDPTTFSDAIMVLKRYKLWQKAPSRVKEHLLRGTHGTVPETLKPGDLSTKRVHNVVIADNGRACEAANTTLRRTGIDSKILTSSVEMSAPSMGRLLAATASEIRTRQFITPRSTAVIIGGETTVRVSGFGKGGRNQEVALAAVGGIAGFSGTVIAAMGTDGVDGNSDAAGAVIDGNTFFRAKKKKLELNDFSERNDSHAFFNKLRDTLITGPTGTNVGDVYLAMSLI